MAKRPARTVSERALDAETHANRWLGDGNEAIESGDPAKAQVCFDKSQFWLDRANLLTNRAAQAAPRH